ncbi:MAG: hypothetical protein V4723_00180 [Pseudomonadota bacterium]
MFSQRECTRHTLVLLLSAMCALPGFAADAVKVDSNFDAAAMAPKLIKGQSDDNKMVRGIKRLAIGSFDVEFATKGSSSATATRMGQSANANGSNSRSTTSVSMALAGVNEADFQAIVEQLHADFVKQVKAAGIEVVGVDKVMNTETYRKMAASGKPAPHVKSGGNETSVVVTPEGRPVVGFSLMSKGGGLAALSNFSTFTGTMFTGPDIAKELDATVVNVRMVVRFVEQQSSNSSFLGRVSGSATVESKISPTIVAGDTTVHIFSPQGGGALTLQEPIQIDQAAFTGVRDVTSTAAKATGVGLAVLSFAMGSGSSTQIKEFEAVADPVKYRDLVGNGLGQVSSMMVHQLLMLR